MTTSVLVILITALIVYVLANHVLGYNLRLKPLAFCAGCAYIISLILPRIIVSYTSFLGTLGVLAIFAIIAAYFIAYYEDLDSNIQANEITVNNTEIAAPELPIIKDNSSTEQSEIKQSDPVEPKVEPKLETKIEIDVRPQPDFETPLKTDSEIDSEQDITGEIWCAPLDADLGEANQISHLLLPPPDRPKSLDELIDQAFTLKEQHDDNEALKIFREALQLYPESEAAPYLTIEIGGILKQQGAYDEAIKVFTDARKLPALADNSIISQEFIETVAYLRIVKNILLANKVGLIPFNRIPDNLNREIETEFQEWRNLA